MVCPLQSVGSLEEVAKRIKFSLELPGHLRQVRFVKDRLNFRQGILFSSRSRFAFISFARWHMSFAEKRLNDGERTLGRVVEVDQPDKS